jgi:hypothetical protein
MQSIQDVLVQLDAIIAQCAQRPSRQAYFAILYRQMTAAVQAGIAQGAFEDGPRMEKLDVLFASRYVDAWHAFQQGKPTTLSWHLSFSAAQQKLTVIQHLLLGINTHINLDLGIAAAQTAPGDSIFDLQHDFEKINDVIADLSIAMQEKLTRIWWPMRYVSKIARGKDQAVLNFSIDKARDAAWANAVALAQADAKSAQAYIRRVDETVCGIGRKIYSPGTFASLVLKPVSLMEPSDISSVIKKLI